MMKLLGKEMMSLLLLLTCCSMKQLSNAFVVQSNKVTGVTKVTSHPKIIRSATVEDKIEGGNIANDLLEALEKRLKEGSLSGEETNDVLTASDLLLEHLEEIQLAPKEEVLEDVATEDEEDIVRPQQFDDQQVRFAISQLDVDAVHKMLKSGMEMDEEITNLAFWSVVEAVDRAEAEDLPLAGDVTRMLHLVFDSDMKLLLQREKQTTNVTCMQPDDADGIGGAARRMNYVFDDGDHKNLPLKEGRRCEGGTCCDECSRNIFPTFALDHESSLEKFPDIASFTFNELEKVPAASILQFVRLVERVRRTIAHEYGLPLKTILPLQAYSRKYVAGTTQQGGGGGEGDFVILHTDEATHTGYHYSCVLYLSTQGVDFRGGDFVFNDPADEEESGSKEDSSEEDIDYGRDYHMSIEEEIRRAGRKLSPFKPTRGAAVIFSSGWENMHEVEKITSGIRYAVPCFFTTCPVPQEAYKQMKVGLPKTDEDIADDWLHLLLAHRKETPNESVGRVKELLMKWHYMCTPLNEH